MKKFIDYLWLILMIIGSSFVSIFIMLFVKYLDVYALNFYRFVVAGIFFGILSYILYKKKFVDLFKKEWMPITIFSLINVIVMVISTKGTYLTSATLPGFIFLFNLLPLTIISCAFFVDEREALKSRSFIMGGILNIIGSIGIIEGYDFFTPGVMYGILLLVFSYIISDFTLVIQKKLLKNTEPLILAAQSVIIMSLGFFCLNITGMGALSSIKSLSVWLIIILFSSGIIGIGAGVVLYLVCIKRFGIVTTSMLNLSTPFFTVLFAFIVLNETINLKQFIFGIILLIGSVLIVKSTFKHKLPEKIPL